MAVLVSGGHGPLGHHLDPALQERRDAVRVRALPGADTDPGPRRRQAT
jgi:nucleoside-diphosphate-sugar epimerase